MCIHIRTISAGDESMDYCRVSEKICLLEAGYPCEVEENEEEEDE